MTTDSIDKCVYILYVVAVLQRVRQSYEYILRQILGIPDVKCFFVSKPENLFGIYADEIIVKYYASQIFYPLDFFVFETFRNTSNAFFIFVGEKFEKIFIF